MTPDQHFQLSACDGLQRLIAGEISASELTESCLQRIAEVDDEVEAWAFIDADFAREQARAADAFRQSGHGLGALHGLPVAVKDIVDVASMPCENGTPIDAGRRPEHNAAVASLLRQAGAVILGKTVTTELAFYHPGKTHNPHDASRTPGGSSSGSAAAVASHMAPLAIGSQTNGSMIRPAAFCGVVGFKPTYGLIPRSGVLTLSPALDTLGVFGRTVEDCALLAEALTGFDAADDATQARPKPNLVETCSAAPPVRPAIAFAKTSHWGDADEATREGFGELVEALGEACDEIELPEIFSQSTDWHRSLMTAEIARHIGPYEQRAKDQLSDVMRATLKEGREVSALTYQTALDGRDILNGGMEAIFDRYDAIITPAAAGEAPVGLESTGNPVFATLWTYCGLPALSLPLLEGPNGHPVGVQLVGRRHNDARLLRTARWLMNELSGNS